MWIDRLTANLDHVVEVWTRRETCAAYQRDDVSPLDTLAFLDQGFGEMAVYGFNAVPMIDSNQVAHLGIEADLGDAAAGGSLNRGVGSRTDIQPIMPSRLFGKGRHTRSEA